MSVWVVIGSVNGFLIKVLYDGNLGLETVVIKEPACRQATQTKYLKK
jgi:hypothetical protein